MYTYNLTYVQLRKQQQQQQPNWVKTTNKQTNKQTNKKLQQKHVNWNRQQCLIPVLKKSHCLKQK